MYTYGKGACQYNVIVQLGRLDLPERQVECCVFADDDEQASSTAMVQSCEKLKDRFGADNPILSKTRHVISIDKVQK
jgi:hypothetical protein